MSTVSATLMVSFEDTGVVQYSTAGGPADADYGDALALLGSRLDELARRLGIRPLGEYHYADPEMLSAIASGLEGRARENIERVLLTQRQWHAVEDGRQTVGGLLKYLNGLDEATARERHPDLLLGGTLEPVLADLLALARTISSSDSRFHLESL